MQTIDDLIRSAEARLTKAAAERKNKQDALVALRASLEAGDTSVTRDAVNAAIAERDTADQALTEAGTDLTELRAEKANDEKAARLVREVSPAAARPAYDQVARVGAEERTYAAHKERGFDQSTGRFAPGTKPGGQFLRDVGLAALGDYGAQARLTRHSTEESVERAAWLERAAGTGAFAGLVVPQYLTDMYAPAAAANRPFANAINKHDLPPSGMSVNISRITTATSTAIQTENAAVSETDIDDTLMTINVQTNAGQQTLSRQAIERGTGIEGVTLDDLYRRYHTVLDSTLLNQATNGLTNVATSVAYTDASPTVAEMYPKILEALSGVEAALLDQDPGDNIAVMHSRRWYWIQNALGSTWPLAQQPGINPQMGMTNLATAYGSGVRGVLPNGTPVIVDNNIATTLGGGTEDEIYIGSRREFHLWEDPDAPMLIRTEATKAASLGVLFVVYGYFAYTHARYAHARKIAGTGLIAPTFTGV